MKKIRILFLTLFILVSFTACHVKPHPSDFTLAYYTLLTQQDSSAFIKLGMSEKSASKLLDGMYDSLNQQIQTTLSMSNRIEISPSQVTTLQDAYFKALQGVSATVKEQKKDDYYIVTLSTTYIDTIAIDQAAINKSLATVDISQYKDQNKYLADLAATYIPTLIAQYQTALPSTEVVSKDFIFTKQEGIFLPQDSKAFITTLCQMVCHLQ